MGASPLRHVIGGAVSRLPLAILFLITSRLSRVGPRYVSAAAALSFHKTVFSSVSGSLSPPKSPL